MPPCRCNQRNGHGLAQPARAVPRGQEHSRTPDHHNEREIADNAKRIFPSGHLLARGSACALVQSDPLQAALSFAVAHAPNASNARMPSCTNNRSLSISARRGTSMKNA